jgi:hypothetical protein
MKRFFQYLIIIYLISPAVKVNGQDTLDSASVLLESLYGRLSGNYNDNSRIQIYDSINRVIDWYVRTDTVFNHKFDNLRYLGQITSPDSTLKIVTWNAVLGSTTGKYYCYFIKKDENCKRNKIFFLTARYNDAPVKTDTTYTSSDWYGALYYDLRPCLDGDKLFWIILGIDYGNPLISKKIIDVMELNDDGTIVFGRKWFAAGETYSYRAVLEYASNASISLRFTSDTSIVFDHLVPITSSHVNNRQYYGPDYSTDSYSFEKGKWILKINVDARNME